MGREEEGKRDQITKHSTEETERGTKDETIVEVSVTNRNFERRQQEEREREERDEAKRGHKRERSSREEQPRRQSERGGVNGR